MAEAGDSGKKKEMEAISALRNEWLGRWVSPDGEAGRKVTSVSELSGMFPPDDRFLSIRITHSSNGNYSVFERPRRSGESDYLAYECKKCGVVTMGPPNSEIVSAEEAKISCHNCVYPIDTLQAPPQDSQDL